MNKTNMIIIAVVCVYLIIIFPKITVSGTSSVDVSNAETATGMNNEARNDESVKNENNSTVTPSFCGYTA